MVKAYFNINYKRKEIVPHKYLSEVVNGKQVLKPNPKYTQELDEVSSEQMDSTSKAEMRISSNDFRLDLFRAFGKLQQLNAKNPNWYDQGKVYDLDDKLFKELSNQKTGLVAVDKQLNGVRLKGTLEDLLERYPLMVCETYNEKLHGKLKVVA